MKNFKLILCRNLTLKMTQLLDFQTFKLRFQSFCWKIRFFHSMKLTKSKLYCIITVGKCEKNDLNWDKKKINQYLGAGTLMKYKMSFLSHFLLLQGPHFLQFFFSSGVHISYNFIDSGCHISYNILESGYHISYNI